MPKIPSAVALKLPAVRTGVKSALRVAKDAYYLGIPSLRKPRTDAAGLAEVRTNFGVFYVRPDDTDMEVLRDIFIKRAYELDFNRATSVVRREYNAMVERGRKPLILDVGANAGFASRFFALEYPEAAIIAVEPDPENYRVLCENVKSVSGVTSITWRPAVPISAANSSAGGNAAIDFCRYAYSREPESRAPSRGTTWRVWNRAA